LSSTIALSFAAAGGAAGAMTEHSDFSFRVAALLGNSRDESLCKAIFAAHDLPAQK
jgi:hypothetical protein